MSQKILLRSVYGKVGQIYTINPCPNNNGQFCKWVRRIDSQGNMILSDADKNESVTLSDGTKMPLLQYLIPENKEFKIQDGQEFDLSKIEDLAEWEAIKNAPLIASSRYEKNPDGTYKIDGNVYDRTTHPRNGAAELYVDIPGIETEARVSKAEKVYNASKYIFESSQEKRLQITKIMGKHMEAMPPSDITEYLIEVAKRNPDRIIKLYKDENVSDRLLFMDAKDKHVIILKGGFYIYGEDINLGATDDNAVAWLIDPKNKKIAEMIRQDTYPEMYKKDTKTK